MQPVLQDALHRFIGKLDQLHETEQAFIASQLDVLSAYDDPAALAGAFQLLKHEMALDEHSHRARYYVAIQQLGEVLDQDATAQGLAIPPVLTMDDVMRELRARLARGVVAGPGMEKVGDTLRIGERPDTSGAPTPLPIPKEIKQMTTQFEGIVGGFCDTDNTEHADRYDVVNDKGERMTNAFMAAFDGKHVRVSVRDVSIPYLETRERELQILLVDYVDALNEGNELMTRTILGALNTLMLEGPHTPKSTPEPIDLTYLACQMYNAYGAECDFKTWDNKPMPVWDDICTKSPEVRDRWMAAARRAQDLVTVNLRG